MRNKVTFFSLFLLTSIVMLGSIPNQAQASEAESLFRIASQAHEELNIQLSRTENAPSEIKRLFQQGTDGLDALKEAISSEDTSASREHFLSTMEIFKKITHMISDQLPVESSMDVISIRQYHQSELERMEKYVVSLETLAEKHGVDINFIGMYGLFDLAKQQIREEQHDDAKKSIDQIKHQIVDINKILQEEAQQKTKDRAKIFVQQYLERLDKIISEAEELGYPADVVDKLKEAKEKLSESSNPNQIIQEIKQILPIKQQFELFKFERVISKVNYIEEKLDNVSITNEIDYSIIEDARSLMIELRIQVEERNYDDAQSILQTLTIMLKTLETSPN